MKPRFMLLLGVAGGLAILLGIRTTEPAKGGPTFLPRPGGPTNPIFCGNEKKMIWEFPLPGEEPEEAAELGVRVHLDPTDGKNRLYFSVTEAHGYYVEYVTVKFFYKETPESTIDDSPLILTERINDYVLANQTLVGCRELVPAELHDIGGQMGATENWGAEIVRYYRARLENPEVLHHIVKAYSCD